MSSAHSVYQSTVGHGTSGLSLEARLQAYINSRPFITTFDVPFPSEYKRLISKAVSYQHTLQQYQSQREHIQDLMSQLQSIVSQFDDEAQQLHPRPQPSMVELVEVASHQRELKLNINTLLSSIGNVSESIDPESTLEVYQSALQDAYETLLHIEDPSEYEIIVFPINLPKSLITPASEKQDLGTDLYGESDLTNDAQVSADLIVEYKHGSVALYLRPRDKDSQWTLDVVLQLVHPTSLIDSLIQEFQFQASSSDSPSGLYLDQNAYLTALGWATTYIRAQDPLQRELGLQQMSVIEMSGNLPHTNNPSSSLSSNRFTDPASTINRRGSSSMKVPSTSQFGSPGFPAQSSHSARPPAFNKSQYDKPSLEKPGSMSPRGGSLKTLKANTTLSASPPLPQLSTNSLNGSPQTPLMLTTPLSRNPKRTFFPAPLGSHSSSQSGAPSVSALVQHYTGIIEEHHTPTRRNMLLSKEKQSRSESKIRNQRRSSSVAPSLNYADETRSYAPSVPISSNGFNDAVIVPSAIEVTRNNQTFMPTLVETELSCHAQHDVSSPTHAAFYGASQLQAFDRQNIDNGLIHHHNPYLFSHYQTQDDKMESLRFRLFFGNSFQEYCDYFSVLKAAFDHEQAQDGKNKVGAVAQAIDENEEIQIIPLELIRHGTTESDLIFPDPMRLVPTASRALTSHVVQIPSSSQAVPVQVPSISIKPPPLRFESALDPQGDAQKDQPLSPRIPSRPHPSKLATKSAAQLQAAVAAAAASATGAPLSPSAPDSPKSSKCVCPNAAVLVHDLLKTNIGFDSTQVPQFHGFTIRSIFEYAAQDKLLPLSIILRTCRHVMGRQHDDLWRYLWKLSGAKSEFGSEGDQNDKNDGQKSPKSGHHHTPSPIPEYIFVDPYEDYQHDDTNDSTNAPINLVPISTGGAIDADGRVLVISENSSATATPTKIPSTSIASNASSTDQVDLLFPQFSPATAQSGTMSSPPPPPPPAYPKPTRSKTSKSLFTIAKASNGDHTDDLNNISVGVDGVDGVDVDDKDASEEMGENDFMDLSGALMMPDSHKTKRTSIKPIPIELRHKKSHASYLDANEKLLLPTFIEPQVIIPHASDMAPLALNLSFSSSSYIPAPSPVPELSPSIVNQHHHQQQQLDQQQQVMAKEGQIKVPIATLCEIVSSIDQVDGNGWTPLLYACFYGHLECVKLLLTFGANPRFVSPKDGASPLYVALDQHHFQVCDLLVEVGVSLHLLDPATKMTPLMFVAQTGNLLSCDYLIRHPQKISLNTTTLTEGYTALCLATLHNHISIVDMLLVHKADVNIQTSDGYTALMLACNTKNELIADLLISCQAFINTYTHVGITALVCAITQQNYNLVYLLLSKHANPNPMKHRSSITPIIAAVLNNDLTLLQTLVQKYGAIVNTIDYQGRTALMHACTYNSPPDIIKFLISQGAELNIRENSGKTALSLANEYGHHHLVRMLFGLGAKRYHLYHKTNEVLQLAVIQANKRGVEKILSDAGNVNLHLNMAVVHSILPRDPIFEKYQSTLLAATAALVLNAPAGGLNKQEQKRDLLSKRSNLMDESDYSLLMYCIEKDSMVLGVDYHNLPSKWYDLALLDRGQYNYLNFTNNISTSDPHQQDLHNQNTGIHILHTLLQTADPNGKMSQNAANNHTHLISYYSQYDIAKSLVPPPALVLQLREEGGSNFWASYDFSTGGSLSTPDNTDPDGVLHRTTSGLGRSPSNLEDVVSLGDHQQALPIAKHNTVQYQSNNIDPKLNRRSSQQFSNAQHSKHGVGLMIEGQQGPSPPPPQRSKSPAHPPPPSHAKRRGSSIPPIPPLVPHSNSIKLPPPLPPQALINHNTNNNNTNNNNHGSPAKMNTISQNDFSGLGNSISFVTSPSILNSPSLLNQQHFPHQIVLPPTVHLQPGSVSSRSFGFHLQKKDNGDSAKKELKFGPREIKHNVGNGLGFRDIIDLLLKYKVDVNDYTSNGGVTALMLCARLNRKDLCKILLKEPFYADINARDNLGRSVLGYAKLEANVELSDWLFGQGARL